ncbi:MAG: hypothetical protein JWO35_690 [Candidatus Saccharibacteria bacterium]|nr:hypothetical protein [Candidatus Saccharibacteria bacterium]
MTGEQYHDPNQELLARIDELEVENLLLRELAYTDALTGLGNLWALKEQIDTLVQERQPFAVFYIDLKNFKTVNEATGHDGGDDALKEAGHFFASAMRETDAWTRIYPNVTPKPEEQLQKELIATRKGGDEFALLMRVHTPSQQFSEGDRRGSQDLTEDNLNNIMNRLATQFSQLPNVAHYNQRISTIAEDLQLGLHVDWAIHDPAKEEEESFDLSSLLKAADPKTNRETLLEPFEQFEWRAATSGGLSTEPGDESIVEGK